MIETVYLIVWSELVSGQGYQPVLTPIAAYRVKADAEKRRDELQNHDGAFRKYEVKPIIVL
jgi:hypothetical protein